MATRNPTDFTTWPNAEIFVGNKPILAAPLDTLLDDMEFILDAEQMCVSDHFAPIGHATASYLSVRRYSVNIKDICDVDAVGDISCMWGVKAWGTGGSNTGKIQLTGADSIGSKSVNVSVTSATPSWIMAVTATQFVTNDTVIHFDLASEITAATKIWLSGFCLFAVEN